MISLTKYLSLVFALLVCINTSKAQFVNIEFEIEPELSATLEQQLSFGNQIAGAGQVYLNLGDLNTGVFSIRAINTQSLYLILDFPESLINTSNFSGDNIPLDLDISYNTEENNALESTNLPNDMGLVNLTNDQTNANDIWKLVYIYVYGSIEIGNISPGIYEGTINLFVEYF